MVYRAERLYSALTDCQKVYKYVSGLIYETPAFDAVYCKQDGHTKEDIQLVKKREQLIKRL